VTYKRKLIDSLSVLWLKVEETKFGSCDFGAFDVRHGLSKVCHDCKVSGCGRDMLGDGGSIGRKYSTACTGVKVDQSSQLSIR